MLTTIVVSTFTSICCIARSNDFLLSFSSRDRWSNVETWILHTDFCDTKHYSIKTIFYCCFKKKS